MPPDSPVFYIIPFIMIALVGMAVGAVSGWLVSLVLKNGRQGKLKDALLGSLGFVVGYIGCALVPLQRNTITFQMIGGNTFTSTMDRYQHPARVAVVIAALLPLLHELFRSHKARTHRL